MKKSLRMIAVVLTVLMVFVMMVGCDREGNNVVGEQKTSSENTQDTSEPKEIPTVKLSFLQHGTPNFTEKPKYYDETLTAINEKLAADLGFKIEVDYVSYSDDVFLEKMVLDLSSGKVYDMIRGKMSSDDTTGMGVAALAKKGMIMDLTPILDTAAPNFKKNIPENVWKEVTVGGKIVALPTTGFNVVMGSWIRGEWLDKAGLKVPTTLEEFENVMKVFRDGDFDENGKNDTLPYATVNNSAEMVFLGLFTETPGDFLNSEGKIMSKYFDPGYKMYVELLRKWYAEKYIDDQFFNGNENTISELYSQNKLGIAGISVWHLEWGPINAVEKNRPEVKTKFVKQFDIQMKKYLCPGLVGAVAFASANSKNYEYAVKYHDWYVFDKDNYYLVNKGIKGKSYDIKDGAVVVPEGENAQTTAELTGFFSVLTTTQLEFEFYPAATPKESIKAYDYAVKEVPLDKLYVAITNYVNPVIPDDIKLKKDDADSMVKQYISDIIKGRKDMSTYDEMLKKYEDMGGLKYYDLLTEEYAKQK